MSIVITDTEYTTWPGALERGWTGPGEHREIVQIAAIRVDDAFAETAALDLLAVPLFNPQLSPLFTELTGISQDDVSGRGLPFPEALSRFAAFCGAGPVVCMNADEAVFRENCSLWNLPPPPGGSWHRLRPFLELHGVDTARYSSGELHSLTAHPLQGHVHNALHDVRSMSRWLLHAQVRGIYKGIRDLPTGAPSWDPRSGRRPEIAAPSPEQAYPVEPAS